MEEEYVDYISIYCKSCWSRTWLKRINGIFQKEKEIKCGRCRKLFTEKDLEEVQNEQKV